MTFICDGNTFFSSMSTFISCVIAVSCMFVVLVMNGGSYSCPMI